MKALFNCHHEHMEWVETFFPDKNPYLLPIVNKPLLEYWLDFCAISSVTEVLILDSEYDARIAELIGDGSKWNLKIHYIGDNISSDCSQLHVHHSEYFNGEDAVLVLSGFFFQHYNQNSIPDFTVMAHPGWSMVSGGEGLMAVIPGEGLLQVESRVTPLSGLDAYYYLNMYILKEERDSYVIPGYMIDNGIYTGMNDVIPPSCRIDAPAVLGNNISLGQGCSLEGGVILGDKVVVDNRSVLAESLVLGNTYIGADLEFIGKIVYRGNVIDPETNTSVELLDAQLTGELRRLSFGYIVRVAFGWLGALVLILLMILPFILLVLLGVHPKRKGHILAEKTGGEFRKLAYPDFGKRTDSPLHRCFYNLSLGKFFFLFHVLTGNMRLVGDYPYQADGAAVEAFVRKNYPSYHAGVFSLSGLAEEDSSEVMRNIDDLYLQHNRSLRMGITIIVRSLIGRLFGVYA